MSDAVEEPRDAIERRIAYADFRRMPVGQRSVSALWELYCQRKREGETVPTTNRNTIFRWKNEDDWLGRLVKEEDERLEAEKADQTRFRRRALFRLSAVFDDAILEWHKLILDPNTDANVKAKLLVELADRVGFPKESRIAANRRSDETPAPPQQAPSLEATEEELAAYYARTGGQG